HHAYHDAIGTEARRLPGGPSGRSGMIARMVVHVLSRFLTGGGEQVAQGDSPVRRVLELSSGHDAAEELRPDWRGHDLLEVGTQTTPEPGLSAEEAAHRRGLPINQTECKLRMVAEMS